MLELSKIVDNLEVRILNLVKLLDNLREENDLLKSQLSQNQQELNIKNEQLKDNDKIIQSLRVAKTIQGSDNYSKGTTQKINALIKEIDWCISQLSE